MDGRSQGKGGATRSASLMRDEDAPGPLTPASAPQAPGHPDREAARNIGGAPLTSGPIGRSLRRLEDPRLLRGEGRFVDDLAPAGCLHVGLVRSPIANGVLKGVTATFTAADLEPTCRPLVVHLTTRGVISPPRPI